MRGAGCNVRRRLGKALRPWGPTRVCPRGALRDRSAPARAVQSRHDAPERLRSSLPVRLADGRRRGEIARVSPIAVRKTRGALRPTPTVSGPKRPATFLRDGPRTVSSDGEAIGSHRGAHGRPSPMTHLGHAGRPSLGTVHGTHGLRTREGRHMAKAYRVCVKGHLDRCWSASFEGLTITHGADGTTALAGVVPDRWRSTVSWRECATWRFPDLRHPRGTGIKGRRGDVGRGRSRSVRRGASTRVPTSSVTEESWCPSLP